jgi:hypothetical protein
MIQLFFFHRINIIAEKHDISKKKIAKNILAGTQYNHSTYFDQKRPQIYLYWEKNLVDILGKLSSFVKKNRYLEN